MDERLTITVGRQDGDADAVGFAEIVLDTIHCLNKMSADSVGTPESEWRIVELGRKKPSHVTIARPYDGAVKMFFGAFRSLEQYSDFKNNLPLDIVEGLKALANRAMRDLRTVIFSAPGLGEYSPTVNVIRSAEAILGRRHYSAPGSVDGRLEFVNIHRRDEFRVWDDVEGDYVICRFSEEILDVVMASFGKRVCVEGVVQYKRMDDRPVSITVETVELLDDEKGRPKYFSEMPPIDMTDGVPSEEHIRQLRDF